MTNRIMSSSDSSVQQEKRICQRIGLNKQVQLKLADGQIINGITEDLSLGGLKIITEDTLESETIKDVEQIALLQIKFMDGQLSSEYPCTVVRCGTGSLSLKLDKKKAASFGMMLTSGTFKQKV